MIKNEYMHVFRSLLGVKRITNLSGLYMELGRMPLAVFRQVRITGLIIRSVHAMLQHDTNQGHTYNNLNWASHIKSFLD